MSNTSSGNRVYRCSTRELRSGSKIAIVVAAFAISFSTPAAAQNDDQALRAELNEMKRRIAELEARLAARSGAAKTADAEQASNTAPVVLASTRAASPVERRDPGVLEPGETPLNPTSPTYWRVPGTDTQVRFSGLIRLGAYKDLVDNLNSYKFRSGEIHPKGDPRRYQGGNIQSQLRLSRISFDTKTPTNLGELRTTLSADFAGAEPKTYQGEALQQNGFHFRLMHAYGNLGPFPLFGISSEILIGQTWSNFLDDPDTAESIDPAGPTGVPSERQPQVRYTARFGKHAVSLAVENPIGDYQLPGTAAASSFNNTSTTNTWPDFSLKYETEQVWGRAQLSGVLRMFDVDDGLGHRASAIGFGVIAGGTLNVLNKDKIGGQLWYGEGIGKYVPDEFGNSNGFAVNNYGTNQIIAETQKSFGGSLWYRHFWTGNLRSNLAVGYSRQTFAPFIIAASDQAPEIKTAQINLIYVPIPMLDVGVELQYGRKKFRPELGIEEADALRIGFSSRIKFN